jgi:hypothetical protein
VFCVLSVLSVPLHELSPQHILIGPGDVACAIYESLHVSREVRKIGRTAYDHAITLNHFGSPICLHKRCFSMLCPSYVNPLYRKLSNGSNIVRNLIDFYEAWGKPEKADEWRGKLPRKDGQWDLEDNARRTCFAWVDLAT